MGVKIGVLKGSKLLATPLTFWHRNLAFKF
jgi:hypothetical protein